MQARIYQRPKNAMQSGKALTDQWILEFVPAEAKKPDPLMGWAGSGDTREQVKLSFPSQDAAIAYCEAQGFDFELTAAPERKLKFPSQEAAVAYAEKHGIDATVHATPPKKLTLQAYADNFR